MKKKSASTSPQVVDHLAALRRSARNARKLAESTGTPFVVSKDGKPVNLNPVKKRVRNIA